MDKTIVVHGGYDGSSRLKDTKLFSAETAKWKSVSSSSRSPGKRAAHTACPLGNNLFIFGGYDGKQRLADVHMLKTGL